MHFSDKKLVIFDLDGTLITNNTWFDFNIGMGVTAEEDEDLYQEYAAGSITLPNGLTHSTLIMPVSHAGKGEQ